MTVDASTENVDSLRQHSQQRHSPAYGHHARSNSAVSLQPEHRSVTSREDRLAEQVSRRRLLVKGIRAEQI